MNRDLLHNMATKQTRHTHKDKISQEIFIRMLHAFISKNPLFLTSAIERDNAETQSKRQ